MNKLISLIIKIKIKPTQIQIRNSFVEVLTFVIIFIISNFRLLALVVIGNRKKGHKSKTVSKEGGGRERERQRRRTAQH